MAFRIAHRACFMPPTSSVAYRRPLSSSSAPRHILTTKTTASLLYTRRVRLEEQQSWASFTSHECRQQRRLKATSNNSAATPLPPRSQSLFGSKHGSTATSPPTSSSPPPPPPPLPLPPLATSLEEPSSMTTWTIMKEMSKYLWPRDNLSIKLRVGGTIACLVVAKLLNVQVPIYFKGIVDALNIDVSTTQGSVATIAGSLIIAYLVTRTGSAVFQEIRNAIFSRVAYRAVRSASRDVMQHLLKLDMKFHLSRQTGALTKSVDRGTNSIHNLLRHMAISIVPSALEMAMVCGVLGWNFGAQFTAITVLTVAVYTVFTRRTTRWRTRFRVQANAAENKASAITLEALNNYEAVNYFNNTKFEVDRLDKAREVQEVNNIKVQESLAFLNGGQQVILSIGLTAMMYLAADGILQGKFTVGDLVMVNQLLFQLAVPLNFLGTVYRDVEAALTDLRALFKLRSVETKVQEATNAQPLSLVRGGEIRFDNVSFGYVPDRPILQNLSLTIPAGKKVAIVGPSGCGKSTLLRLLFRFYDVESGQILIDDQNIKTVSLESLRQAIGVVPQDTPLFNDTIEFNIRYGDLAAPREKVVAAAQRARIHGMIEGLPDGYNTQVGERGMMISGGEKQRLAVSRLLLKDPPILFFDEATSALDNQTELSVMANINSILREKERTSVFVAHRLRTVADADLIVVLRDGSVAETGTHEELLARNGWYAEHWNAQWILIGDETTE